MLTNFTSLPVYINLNEFHVYTIKWNQSDIIWEIDSKHINSMKFNLSEQGIKSMDLDLAGGVGGRSFSLVTPPTAKDWECPALIVDYVRHYVWNESYTTYTEITEETGPSRDRICATMSGPKDREPSGSAVQSGQALVTSVSASIAVLAIVSLIILKE